MRLREAGAAAVIVIWLFSMFSFYFGKRQEAFQTKKELDKAGVVRSVNYEVKK